jgi:deoxyribonuclease V
MGLATHLGIILDVPTVGSAKSHLYGRWEMPGNERGDFSYILDGKGFRIGAAVRTRSRTKPIFVSPGHLIDIEGSVSKIMACTTRYRIPEPIRMSHRICTEYKVKS